MEAFSKCETIPPLKRAMNLRDDLIYSCCETFSTIFQGHHDSLVKQVSHMNRIEKPSMLRIIDLGSL